MLEFQEYMKDILLNGSVSRVLLRKCLGREVRKEKKGIAGIS